LIRPAPDTMAIVSGYLPVEQGVACYTALRQHADTAKAGGDSRTRDQIMADTMVQRVTGQTAAADVKVELQIMMPLEALLDPHSDKPAMIPGYGPLPADLARDIRSPPRAGNGGADCSPRHHHPKAARAQLLVGIPAAAASTAGSPT
jgi:hypothetical protein